MSDVVKPRTKVRSKTERPRLHKVILLNDDYTPREFVISVLKSVFRMSEDEAYPVMNTAHTKGACVVSVYRSTAYKNYRAPHDARRGLRRIVI